MWTVNNLLFRFVHAFNVDAYTCWKAENQEPVNDRVTENGNIKKKCSPSWF